MRVSVVCIIPQSTGDELNYFTTKPVLRSMRFLVLQTLSPEPLRIRRTLLEWIFRTLGLGRVVSTRREGKP